MRIGIVCLAIVLLLPGCWKRTDSGDSPSTQAPSRPHSVDDGRAHGHGLSDASRDSHDNLGAERLRAPSHGESSSNRVVLSAREIAALASPVVVTIEMTMSSTEQSQGSGFYVRPQIVATNYHVIEGASTGVVRHPSNGDTALVDEVLIYDKEWDVALLSVDRSSGSYSILPLGRLDEVAVGDPAFVMGSPRGLEATFSQGIVSSLRDAPPYHVIQLTTPISPGSSGGPVMNEFGQVIGLVTATVTEGQNLNFAVPVAVLHDLLANIE